MTVPEMPEAFLQLFHARHEAVSAKAVSHHSSRLDASFFLNRQLSDLRCSAPSVSRTLSELAEVFTVYIQSPCLAYVGPASYSRPYLTTSEVGEYQRWQAEHVSLRADPRLAGWEIKNGYILVSRSGRVGEVYWVDDQLDGALVGDCFRVVARRAEDREFLYAFLRSPIALEYISASSYGSVVEHASLAQLRDLPVPVLPPDVVAQISATIDLALASRSQASQLLDEADALVHEVNGLPNLPPTAPDTLDPEIRVQATVVSSLNVSRDQELRLEAHYYSPLARLAVDRLTGCASDLAPLRDVSEKVILGARFKRNYVESSYGIPFLSGRNIVQIRPTDLKYLSSSQTAKLDDLLVEEGWTLITCSGTIGRTCFVWGNFKGFAVSQHIIRVVPREADIDPGYLYAFLSSRYGFEQIVRFRHGSVIDEITDTQLEGVMVPRPSRTDQVAIGDKVRAAYESRAEAIRLEDQAQDILLKALAGSSCTEEG